MTDCGGNASSISSSPRTMDFIFDLKPDYDRYLYIDSDVMVHWDSPDIFDYYNELEKLYVVRDNSGLRRWRASSSDR